MTLPIKEPEHPNLKGFPLLPFTVVGSYPLTPSSEDIMRSYYAKEDPYLLAIKQCINEQVKAGVQIVSDGQTRSNMVNIFASKLAGIRMKGKPLVFSDIQWSSPITREDQEYSQNVIDGMEQQYSEKETGGSGGGVTYPEYHYGNNEKNPLLKGIITGPYTMSQSVTDNYYNDEKEMAFAFARALNKEARALQKIVPILQIDEPFLSVNFIDYSKELVEVLVEGIEVPIAFHVCGDVAAIFSDLIDLPVTLLDHEFTSNFHLFEVVKEYDFPQMLGYGLVRSDHMRIEPLEHMITWLRKAVKEFGVEKIMVDPDCGQRHLTPEVAFQKLVNIRKAREAVLVDL